MLDGYQGHAWWFGAFEFLIQFGLALAPFLANLVPSEKSCTTQAVVLLVVLSTFLMICVWKRPFQELFNRVVTPIICSFEILVIAMALVYGEDQPDFIITLALITVTLQSFVTVMVLLCSFSPLVKLAMKVLKRLRTIARRRASSGNKKETSPRWRLENFREAFIDEHNKIELTKTRSSRNESVRRGRKSYDDVELRVMPKRKSSSRSSSSKNANVNNNNNKSRRRSSSLLNEKSSASSFDKSRKSRRNTFSDI
jgi:hypothetical protein